jgi:hypothetical protein
VTWRAPVKTMLFAAVRDQPGRPAQDVIRAAFAAYVQRSAEAAE